MRSSFLSGGSLGALTIDKSLNKRYQRDCQYRIAGVCRIEMATAALVTLPRKASRPRARRLSPLERRAQLLTCALEVFARRGLGEARHAEIAKEAGVAIATVFFYFPTRAALVQAVLTEVQRFYCAMADRVHGQDLPAPQLLLEHGIAFANSVDTHPNYARVWLDWSTAIRDEVWPQYLKFQDYVVKAIEKTIRRGRHAGVPPGASDGLRTRISSEE